MLFQTLASETTGLDIATGVVIVFQVIVCLLLILVVMMQRPKQEGLGAAFGGDMMSELSGAHATDFLQKGTAWLGTLFFVLTFALAIIVSAGNADKNRSLKNDSEPAPKSAESELPKEDQVDVKNILDAADAEEATKEETESTEETPVEPVTPVVPTPAPAQ